MDGSFLNLINGNNKTPIAILLLVVKHLIFTVKLGKRQVCLFSYFLFIITTLEVVLDCAIEQKRKKAQETEKSK